MAKLTKRVVDAALTREADSFIWDDELRGFGLRVYPSGKKVYVAQCRANGRLRRINIGVHGPMTAEVARKKAIELIAKAKNGGDPAAERDAERKATTVKELGERFLSQYVPNHCKLSTQAEYKRSVELFINPSFGSRRVRSLTTADIAELHGSMAHIPYQANRTLGVLSKMLNLAETWEIRPKHSNPCDDVERYPERKRERFLLVEEIAALGSALAQVEADGSESLYAAAAYRLLLLTGCRLGEIQKLQWKHVHLDLGELRLPDSKTGAKIVYLGQAAIDLLDALPRVEDNPYVIVGKKLRRYLADLQHPWQRIRKLAGLENLRIHDLRHSFASGGLALGEGLPMIGKLLGHTQVQTTARYAHLAADPVRQAAHKIAQSIAAALVKQAERPRPSPSSSALEASSQGQEPLESRVGVIAQPHADDLDHVVGAGERSEGDARVGRPSCGLDDNRDTTVHGDQTDEVLPGHQPLIDLRVITGARRLTLNVVENERPTLPKAHHEPLLRKLPPRDFGSTREGMIDRKRDEDPLAPEPLRGDIVLPDGAVVANRVRDQRQVEPSVEQGRDLVGVAALDEDKINAWRVAAERRHQLGQASRDERGEEADRQPPRLAATGT
jgi:integrase